MGFKENFPLGLYFLKIGGIGFLSEEGKQVTLCLFLLSLYYDLFHYYKGVEQRTESGAKHH